ncbi:MAG: aromatic amino acid transport family protein [Candidatus Sungiibacteriota bacterium]
MPLLKAILTLAGMIIGAGMFAIPFAFAQTGFWLGAAELGILSLVVLGLHLLYADIVLATPHFHRMPGYARLYLGRGASALSWASSLFGIGGALLAYLAVGTVFLQMITARAGGAPSLWWVMGLAGAIAAITFFPLKKEAAINGVLTIFEIAFIIALPLFLARFVSVPHLSGMRMEHIFLPFGVLLFALSGGSVIPDVITVLGRNRKKARAAIIIGSLIPALLYFFFAYAVVGVTGLATSEEAIAGLRSALGGNIAWWASIAGFLAVFTSYVALSANFQAMLRLDMGMPRRAAWFAASAVPILLYFAGFQNFIAIISVVGIFAFGIDGILFFFMGRRIREKQNIRSPLAALAGYAILAVIIIGVAAELLRIF